MTLEELKGLEDKMNIEYSFGELLILAILNRKWEDKDPEFILNNFNALYGQDLWKLLDNEEQDILYNYLQKHEFLKEDSEFKDFVASREQKTEN